MDKAEKPSNSHDVIAAQAVYSKFVLAVYDLWVLGLSNRFIWKCPTPRLLAHYNAHVSPNHLDIGVGTGYFLHRCRFSSKPRIALLDLNPNSLRAAARRIRRYQPLLYRKNILEPLDLEGEPFDSVGMNYLFHCLPGNIREKAMTFDHINACLKPGGVVFGSTLLQEGVKRSFGARRLMHIYNRKGIFHNTGDSLEGLRNELSARYGEYHIEIMGAAALFWARR